MYKQLLRGSRKAFGYYVDEALNTAKNDEFFYVIAVHIVPLIKKCDTFDVLFKKYEHEKKAYFTRYNEIKEKVFDEEWRTYVSVKNAIEAQHLISNEKTRELLACITQAFDQRNNSDSTLYDNAINQLLRNLLEELLELGMIDIVRKYAIVVLHDIYVPVSENDYTKRLDQPFIESFFFSPSLPQIYELDAIWDVVKIQHPWVSWEWLSLIEWCWHTPISFFENTDQCVMGLPLLTAKIYWIELNKIKNRKEVDQVYFLERKLFEKHLKSVVNDVLSMQEAERHMNTQLVDEECDEGNDVLFSCELLIDETEKMLLLQVMRVEGGNPTKHIAYVFFDNNGENSGPFNAMHALINGQVGKAVNISEISGVSGASTAKYFARLKIKDTVIERIFFGKRKTDSVVLKTKKVYGKDLSKNDRKELYELIQKLEKY